MTDSSRDRIEGKSDELTGKVKQGLGDVRNDEDQKTEGQAQETQGEAKQGLAGLKDKVNDVVKKISN